MESFLVRWIDKELGLNRSKIRIAIGAMAVLIGCSAMIQRNGSEKVIEQEDVVYIHRDGVDEKFTSLDIYHHEDIETRRPIVVYIHGGGWAIGDKETAMNTKPKWAIREGWVLVSVNYRLSPDVLHPEHARDSAAAIAWVHEHAEEFGGDAGRIVVMGHSAGAHIAAIVACDEDLLGEYSMTTDQIGGVVLLDGAGYNLPVRMASLPKRGIATTMYSEAFGDDPDLWEAASPTLQAREGDQLPALLAIHVGDREESRMQSTGLVKAWRAAGARAKLHHAPDKTHMTINRALGFWGDKETKLVEEFLGSVFD